MNEHCALSHVSLILARAAALLLVVILANSINDRLAAISDTLEKRR